MELTILMPCLNECESIGFCVSEAMGFLKNSHISGEVLVADNGSTDGSQEIACKLGARVAQVPERGYGSALRAGMKAAQGRYVIMADSDGSYVFSSLMPFLAALRGGADMVIGNRYAGVIEKGAFPWTHRYIGVPILSALGRVSGHCKVQDFHCGLRGVNRESFLRLNCTCTGMEFASEMILHASRQRQSIAQLPANLRRDKRQNAKPHLRTIPDGLRHLKIVISLTK